METFCGRGPRKRCVFTLKRRSKYFWACMTFAKKQNLDVKYKQYTRLHQQCKKEYLEKAKQAQEE